jgi:ABC-type glycerol-3-phosphate transport system permease component
MRTVQLGRTVFQEQFKVEYSLLMAAVVFVTIPSVLLDPALLLRRRP